MEIAPKKISVAINTYNAAEHLEAVLESVKDFDEIVVCDMESTDDTVDIALRHGARVVTFPKGNINICEPARNTAIQSCANEWVLVLDADELVPDTLREYLYKRIAQPDAPDAIGIPHLNLFFDKPDMSNFPNYHYRLVKKSKVDWPPTIHSKPIINGVKENAPKDKKLAFVHYSPSMQAYFSKMCRYTDNEVQRRAGKPVTFWRLWWEPFFRFFKSYILQGGILQGKQGYIRAQCQFVYRFMVMVKLYELDLKKRGRI